MTHLTEMAANSTSSEDMAFTLTMGILSLLGYLYSALLVMFNIKFRNLRFIKMTSPRINLIMIFGATVLYTYSGLVNLRVPNKSSNEVKHQIQYWMLAVGFTLMVGSMLVKGWRVYQLFTYQNKKNKLVKDGNLVVGILVFLVLDVSFMLGWQLSDPVTCHEKTHCVSDHQSTWLLVLSLYKQAFLVLCCFVGWSIRHITFPALDEGRSLLLTAGATLVSIGSISTVAALYPHKQSATPYLSAALCWLTVTIALSAAFIHKMFVIHNNEGNEPYMTSASKYIQQPASNDVGEEMLKILGENHCLKQRLDERDTMINHLKKLMPTPLHTDLETRQTSHGGSSCITNTSNNVGTGKNLAHILNMCCRAKHPRHDENKGPQATVTNQHYMPKHTVVSSNPGSVSIMQSPNLVAMSSPMHTRPILPVNSDSLRSGTFDYNRVANLDLICSIADTYDLPSDSDTYSYISNCLMQKSYDSTMDSGGRRRHRSHGSLLPGLINDQSYHDSRIPPTPNNEPSANISKHRHRQRKKRSRSQSASRQSRHQCSIANGTVMTDSNCSTVIL